MKVDVEHFVFFLEREATSRGLTINTSILSGVWMCENE